MLYGDDLYNSFIHSDLYSTHPPSRVWVDSTNLKLLKLAYLQYGLKTILDGTL